MFEQAYGVVVMMIAGVQEGDEHIRVDDDHSGHSARSSARALRGYAPVAAPAARRTSSLTPPRDFSDE